MSNIQKVLQTILVSFRDHPAAPVTLSRPVVCLSRDFGSGGDAIGSLLAKRLGVDFYDRQILERIAHRLKTDPAMIEALNGGAAPLRGIWLYGAVTSGRPLLDDYRQTLADVVIGIAHADGGVILGHGAHLVLANSGALRVRITGSAAARAKRIEARDGVDAAEARRLVTEADERRDRFLRDNFKVKGGDDSVFDVVINTDRLDGDEKIVDILMTLMSIRHPPVS
ncbi:MAG: cytidylate kinase-like family protein [Rhodospirillaceae bacterium]|nr:cytidylate kinase-like family protein [Rhodospirillaceae bacterium]